MGRDCFVDDCWSCSSVVVSCVLLSLDSNSIAVSSDWTMLSSTSAFSDSVEMISACSSVSDMPRSEDDDVCLLIL